MSGITKINKFVGYLRVVFDFGFERQELIFPQKHFGLGQYHDVRIRRKNSGATLVMEVNQEFKTFFFLKTIFSTKAILLG